MHLRDLPVLVVDCQATSPDPGKGHLLEVAWSGTSASSETAPVVTRLSKLPEGASIPPRMTRVTGLRTPSPLSTDEGETPGSIYRELVDTAGTVARAGGSHRCPTVIHFASFEKRYLHFLHYQSRREERDDDFPFRILCTHAVARRLLPDLPRHGLRAVSGYFGHGVAELRRSLDHVKATAAVWTKSVALLENLGVTDLDSLQDWMNAPPPPRRASSRRFFPMPSKLLDDVPRRPGVYRMLRENGEVLYVGKATVLRDRVRSYFQPGAPHRDLTLEMLSQARDLELVVTGSALEAALFEVDEIKRLRPPYNRALRDRERKLVFASRDFARFLEAFDEEHPIGPLPSGEMWWNAFSALAARLRGESQDFPEPLISTDAKTLEAGLDLFRERLGGAALLAHGAREWAREPEPPESETSELRLSLQYDVGVIRRATAETVSDTLNEVVRRASHLVSRAHWYATISESTFVWHERDGQRIGLVLERGVVRKRLALPEESDAPEPPGYRPPFAERRKQIDLAVYDRLSVLTKEMRRLVAEGRPVSLHLGRRSRLDSQKLARLLRWI